MQVADILERKGTTVHTIHPWDTVGTAVARLVGPPSIGALVVTGTDSPLGILTERDIIAALHRAGHSPGQRAVELRVDAVMNEHPATCAPQDGITTLMQRMTRTRCRHLIVLDHRQQLAGLVSIGDVVSHRVQELETETGVLRDLYLAHRAGTP